MGIALFKIKVMPSSPTVDLEKIKSEAKKIVESNEGEKCRFEEEPVAFGLKALMIYFDLDEEKPAEQIEEAIRKIEDVSSVEIVDMRRAFG